VAEFLVLGAEFTLRLAPGGSLFEEEEAVPGPRRAVASVGVSTAEAEGVVPYSYDFTNLWS